VLPGGIRRKILGQDSVTVVPAFRPRIRIAKSDDIHCPGTTEIP